MSDLSNLLDRVCFTVFLSVSNRKYSSWWRHQMETFSALPALCEGNSPVTAQRPVTRSLDVFFDLRPNKRLSKQSWGWWFETPSRPLCRHCNVMWEIWRASIPWFSFTKNNSCQIRAMGEIIKDPEIHRTRFLWDVNTHPCLISTVVLMCHRWIEGIDEYLHPIYLCRRNYSSMPWCWLSSPLLVTATARRFVIQSTEISQFRNCCGNNHFATQYCHQHSRALFY